MLVLMTKLDRGSFIYIFIKNSIVLQPTSLKTSLSFDHELEDLMTSFRNTSVRFIIIIIIIIFFSFF